MPNQRASSSSLIVGSTIPECFFNAYKRNPATTVYYSKRNGQWVGTTYQQIFDFVLRTIGGLKRLGYGRGQKIAILAENREEWVPTDYAAQWLGGAVAAIYPTSTPDQIQYILNESESVILFVSNQELIKKIANLKDLKTLKTIVAWDLVQLSPPQGVHLMQRDEFLSTPVTEAEAVSLLRSVNPHDLSTLLYTSGTTGEPKGVMLTQANFVVNCRQMLDAVPLLGPSKVTISFLPLSHIYERAVHHIMVLLPATVYFAESIDKLIENIGEVRPQVMTAVPRIFEKMYSKIMERIKNASSLRRKMFFIALEIGKKTFPYRYSNRPVPFHLRILYFVADLLVFRKIRAITGGRAEIFVSGGAPLSQEIAEFFFTAGFKILEGYGLSETCILSVNREFDFKFGTVGLAFRDTEIKIDSDGEICVRGPQVMQGYFKRPDATAEVIDSEGWFHTGDIGEFDAQNFLKITDRKKDLIVTAGGKKVAPQPIENSLKTDPLVESVCLVGDKKRYVVALVVPNLELCRSWGEKKGISIRSLEECVGNVSLRDHFQREIDKVNADLPKYSTVKDFRMIARAFTIEGGELTPTLKLKRRVIQERYSQLIDEMYQGEG